MIVSTIPDFNQSILILRFLQEKYPQAKTVFSAEHLSESHCLAVQGADYVMCVPVVAGQAIEAGVLDNVWDTQTVDTARVDLVKHLEGMMKEWDVTPHHIINCKQ